MLLGQSYQGESYGWYLKRARGKRNMHTTFQSRNLKVGDQFGDLDVDGRMIIECNGVS
jgi:hypothetical protein